MAPPPKLIAPCQQETRLPPLNVPPPLPKRNKSKGSLPEPLKNKNFADVVNSMSDQMNKLKPSDETPRRTSAPGVINGSSSIRRYSEEYRDRNYR
jgi:hypothetical protein